MEGRSGLARAQDMIGRPIFSDQQCFINFLQFEICRPGEEEPVVFFPLNASEGRSVQERSDLRSRLRLHLIFGGS